MTKEDIARLRALAAAATPGPWAPDYACEPGCCPDEMPSVRAVALAEADNDQRTWEERCPALFATKANADDAAFIAAARDALPAALDEIERLREALGEIVVGAEVRGDDFYECIHCHGYSKTLEDEDVKHWTRCPVLTARRALGGSNG